MGDHRSRIEPEFTRFHLFVHFDGIEGNELFSTLAALVLFSGDVVFGNARLAIDMAAWISMVLTIGIEYNHTNDAFVSVYFPMIVFVPVNFVSRNFN